ncbi:hypothetical protein JHK82_020865 [Glycine max]|uniref:Uncharacterized protein n=1 Tax=Glycine max TaxID=3847 RepID=A0A0R0IJC8_SOYBN|nr:hypothetical protein JHK86_020878 [Glycine max]KAG5136134.1 hypothetical protein JHK82_020865 [Glycine max]KAH1050350.1 hypothetical protein GYH30_020702 [Glycine max]
MPQLCIQEIHRRKIFGFEIFCYYSTWLAINLQPCFPNMAKLKACKCLNLIPSSSFFIVILSQFSWLMPLLCCLLGTHQNEFIIFYKSSSRVEGSKQTPM